MQLDGRLTLVLTLLRDAGILYAEATSDGKRWLNSAVFEEIRVDALEGDSPEPKTRSPRSPAGRSRRPSRASRASCTPTRCGARAGRESERLKPPARPRWRAGMKEPPPRLGSAGVPTCTTWR